MRRRLTTLSPLALSILVLLTTTIVPGWSKSREASAEPKRVMILHSFGPRFKPWSDYAEAIRSEISRQSQRPVDYADQSLVSAGVSDEQSEAPFVNYLSALYAGRPLDLIVAIGAPAANFVQRHRQNLFPETPMIFTSVEQRRVQNDKLTENDTVVAVAHDFAAVLENILRVLPRTETIAIVNGTSPNEKFWLGELQRELEPFAGRVKLKWYNELSFADILEAAASLPSNSAILWHLMNVDAAGATHEANSALNKLASSANAPVFSYDDSFFGQALVGGPMYSVFEGSRKAAEVAVRILDGEKAGDIKTPPTKFASPRFDWRQMQRWGISESNLPPGSSIHFRPPAAWQIYRWEILAVCTVVLLQAALIATLLFERRRRHSAEMESRQRIVELAHVNRFSTAGELASSIAHEINQPLGAIMTNSETARLILQSQSPDLDELKEILTEIWRDNRRASEVIRRLRSFVTKAPFQRQDLDLNDLVGEVVNFLSAQARSRQIRMRSELTSIPLRITGDPVQLQQVLSNLILNAMDAVSETALVERAVTVTTGMDSRFAEVSVGDTGPGVPEELSKKIFDPFVSTKAHGMGMGLSIARTIVTAHKGEIAVENRNGAIFRIRLPLLN